LTRLCFATASVATVSLVVNGAAYFTATGVATRAAASERAVAVNVTASACEPSDLNVSAGPVTFSIHNASSGALEWEILDGVMVVAERENIPPGLVRNLTAKLTAGDYQITCGLLSNPRGRLHVTGAPGASAKPSLIDLVGPLAEYRVYASYEIDGLVDDTRRFADALNSGDLKSARAAYFLAHVHYARIAPIAIFFPDLDGAADLSVVDRDKEQLDPASVGFRQLEWWLFVKVEPRDYRPFADKLVNDVTALQARFENLPLTPAPTIAGAVEAMGGAAPAAIDDEAERRGGADLSDVQANVEGVRKIVDLFRPLIAKVDGRLCRALDDDFAALDATLAKYKNAEGVFEPTLSLTSDDRTTMQNTMKKLSGELSQIPADLGLG